ncbi:MAG: sulfite exporter TauE/SafE family protein [Myxococcales bacterium]|nr:sulfite exporter TauE/SafE family protein [Myxococcales bacterium]
MLVVLAVFAGALCRATFGFGDALVAMPLLLLFVPAEFATPLVGIQFAAVGVGLVVQNWSSIRWPDVLRLLVPALVGIPLGMLLLTAAPQPVVKKALGGILIAYGLWGWADRSPRLRHPLWAYGFGVLSGALGAAYNLAGTPLVVYGSLAGWPMGQFRSSLQGLFAPLGIAMIASHAAAGLWTPDVLFHAAICLPAIGLGFWLGSVISKRLSPERFKRLLFPLITAFGVMMLL